MFDWLRQKREACCAGEMPRICSKTDLQSLMSSDFLVLFKHSTACPVSWAAHSQINRYRAKHPDVPIHMVPVIQERAASQKIAEMTGIRHESPQVIVVRRGAVTGAVSHGGITEARLAALVEGH
jgi:bacillithiol system protein YtxJ